MLNEIREEYKMKDNDMRDELHRKCIIRMSCCFSSLNYVFFFIKIYMNIINMLKNKLIKIFLKIIEMILNDVIYRMN
jgi:hypothetical protein